MPRGKDLGSKSWEVSWHFGFSDFCLGCGLWRVRCECPFPPASLFFTPVLISFLCLEQALAGKLTRKHIRKSGRWLLGRRKHTCFYQQIILNLSHQCLILGTLFHVVHAKLFGPIPVRHTNCKGIQRLWFNMRKLVWAEVCTRWLGYWL